MQHARTGLNVTGENAVSRHEPVLHATKMNNKFVTHHAMQQSMV